MAPPDDANSKTPAAATDATSSAKPAGFFAGARAPWDGLRYLNRNPKLWRYAILPILVTLVASVILFGVLVLGAFVFARHIHPHFEGGWYWLVLEVLVGIVTFIVAMLLALVGYFLLNGIVGDYFRGLLAEKVEIQLGMNPDDIVELPIRYHVLDAFHDIGWLILVNAGLLVFHIVPVVGSIVALCGSFYFEFFTFGVDYLDYPLALRGMRRKDKHAFARQRRRLTLGLGTVTFAFSFVPILGSILLTSAAVGAVLLHRRLEAAAHAASPA